MKRSEKSFLCTLCFRLASCCIGSVLFLSSAFGTHPSTIDPNTSPLPRGPGFSSAYYGDVGIESNPAVIFADNFEAGDYLTKWDNGNRRNLLSLVDESAVDPVLGTKSLRAGATSNQFSGSGLIEWFPSADSVFVRFDVKFDKDLFGVWHLSRLRGNRADNRWSSFGTAGTVPDGTNFFTTGVEPIGRTTDSPGKWKTYTYWPDMPGSFGYQFPAVDPPVVPKDEWMSVEIMLKHNTPGVDGSRGLRDGEQAFWINGELMGTWGKIRWRDDETLTANAFVLETYLQDALSDPKNVVFFDNVVIASEYIGPSGLGVPEPATGVLLITSLMFIGTARLFCRSGR